jgi:hypothetical protein
MNLQSCPCCLAVKDIDVKEVYPFPEEVRFIEDPIDPLLELDVQPAGDGEWRRIRVCHQCFSKLDPDMWISEHCLKSIGCKTPFTDLPLMITT